MTFTTETAREGQAKGVATKKKQKEDWWAFIASGGLRIYLALMIKLAKGEKINKYQEQFMDRSEKSFSFIKARKTDITTDGKELPHPILPIINE